MKKGTILVLSMLGGVVTGAGTVGKIQRNKIEKVKSMSEKHLELFLMMNKWVKVKQKGKNIASYLEKNGYKNIAIYGMSYAGETLINELKGTNVSVAYGIDKKADSIYADVDVVSIDDDLAPVDVIVVTAITFFDEIEENLSEKLDCPIISLEDILYEV